MAAAAEERSSAWLRAKTVVARNWYTAGKLWSWLWMVRRWRARTRLRAAWRSAQDEERAVDVPEGEEVGRLAAAAGVLESAGGRWSWLTFEDEITLAGGPEGPLTVGPGLGARAAMARRRVRWGGSQAAMEYLRRWEIAEGRAESANHMWAVEALVSVRRPTVRRGRELLVTVRWAGVNPLFECPWGESELSIRALTSDLKDAARRMERERYPELEGPRPARVSGRIRSRYEGDSVVLGSVWAEGPCSADGARASRHRP